jgi:hypothetical protein
MCINTLCPTLHHCPHSILTQTLMQSLTPAQHNYILELFDQGHSSHTISSTTDISVGFISNIHSKHHSTLSKSAWGWPHKLSSSNTQYAICLTTSQIAENATEVAKSLQNITNTSFSFKTLRRALRGSGMKAVTK